MPKLDECEKEVKRLRQYGGCLECGDSILVRIIEEDGEYGLEYRCRGGRKVMCSHAVWGTHNGVVGVHTVWKGHIPAGRRR